ncbi:MULTISPECIES: DEAD/DEAH box helicase [unclassified Chelatococcus]|uniref:DEAD/DEAH box helicase n=1 Tax=unclassified Chelatococcus TaxID=2638111 RepID=UPI001BCCC876|nr:MULTISPECIES: DEAD/DEAH box helicase [unclassified Chelatococcus]MBS7696252.1 DEAD/DEAH box helicase [Chelatococcus sp. YT9]MBX3560080.1 DEAD/DEAH box helicase [Chelatococcus sp.]
MRPLFDHQVSALAMLRHSLASGKRRPMLQAPTGFGKTMLGAAVVDGALRKGNRVVFCVPAVSLIDQTVEAFWNEGIRDVGVIQATHPMTDGTRPVQVASVQTLGRRRLPPADVVVIDEAHVMFDLYRRWMADEDWQKVPFVGLSATPWARGLGKYYDDLLIAATTSDLIERGFLSPFRVFAPSHPDLSGVKTIAGDYHEGQLSEAMDKGSLTADIVTTWLQRGENRPTLCFGVDRAHARKIQERFEAAGVPTGYIDAHTTTDERNDIRKAFHAGDVKIVCNVGCLTTGIDWDVRCIILARPTKSEMLYVQIIGRGLRTADGKDDCLILDHSDTTLKLGFVTDIRHEHLDLGKPKKSSGGERDEKPEALPKECPSCAYLKPAKVHVCPNCGFAPQRQSTIECAPGDLVELAARGSAKRKSDATMDEKISFYAQLKGHGQNRGYRSGWAYHAYVEKFGVKPNDPRLSDVRPQQPGDTVRNWIKAYNIRKSMGRKLAARGAAA